MPTVVYPVTTGYVADWDIPRAVAELIANAYDADPHPSIRWRSTGPDTGRLTITDRGAGVPLAALAFGHTDKDDSQIGQFGEGAKIALLVLSRNDRPVTIVTTAWSATARIEHRPLVDGADPLDLLTVELDPTRRRRVGTTANVTITAEEWAAVRRRFLRLSRPRWATPASGACVIPGLEPGHVYVGGVLVAAGRDLSCSYDLSLTDAKRLQNRDRSIIDGFELERLIRTAMATCTDRETIGRWFDAILDGTLPSVERCLPYEADVADDVKRTWRRVRAARLPGKVCWRRPGHDDEASALDAADRGWKVLDACGDTWQFERAMALAAVPTAAAVARRRGRSARFVARERLDRDRLDILRTAERRARRAFGADAVPRIRIFDRAPADLGDCDGFYDPVTGTVAVHAQVLTSVEGALAVIVHEVGHRVAHRAGRCFDDRSRDFERTLCELAARALLRR